MSSVPLNSRATIFIAAAVVLATTTLLAGGLFTQDVYAIGGTIDQTLCESADFGGSWLGGADTCSIAGAGGVFVNSGETLTIPSGVTLVVTNTVDGSTGLNNIGTIENHGVLTVVNHGDDNFGIGNFGIINNNAVMNVINEFGTTGIYNFGTINNNNEINIGFVSGPAININAIVSEGTINNYGAIIMDSGQINILGGTFNIASGSTLDMWGATVSVLQDLEDQTPGSTAAMYVSGIVNIRGPQDDIFAGLRVNHNGQLLVSQEGIVNTITDGFFFVIGGIVDDYGTLNFDDGTLFNLHGVVNVNSDGVLNFNQDGGIRNERQGDYNVNDGGTINVNSGGSINEMRTLTVNSGGVLNIQQGGIVGVFALDPSGFFLPSSMIIEPGGQVNLAGLLDVKYSGSLDVNGNLGVSPEGTLKISNGELTNIGVITSKGEINNMAQGTLNNNGRIDNDCGTFINDGTFSGNPVNELCDTDDDGIRDNVDTQPNTFSNEFDDAGIGGTTTGTIVTRGDQELIVMEAPNPDGVEVYANTTSGGVNPAEVSACSGSALYTLNSFDDIIVTCGSVNTEIIKGPIEVVFTGDDGATASATLQAGFVVKFEPDTFSFIAPESNPGPISVTFEGNIVTLDAGEIVQLQTVRIDIKPDGTPNTINVKKDKTVSVVLFGSSSFNIANIDKATLKFGGTSPQSPIKTQLQDVNKDGFMDLLMQYKVPPLGFAVADTQGCITGLTQSGEPFMGCDSVRILNK